MDKIHPIILKILNNRGITEEADILEFLSEKPSLTYDPFLLKNMKAGVDLILSSIKLNKKICIYGDYDADGVTSISLLFQILSHLTQKITYYIPSRFDEGYGLNKDAIDLIKKNGTELIITVDCGSVSYDEVEHAKKIGMDIIVTDHHNINDKPADCILINPKQQDCSYPFKQLAGCGVAFKLAQGIQRSTNLSKTVLTEVLDLVAIGTVGDIVPLIDENRTLVKYGMNIIHENKRLGLNQLIKEVGLVKGNIISENIAYSIVPHLNAAGRILDARTGVELLTSFDKDKISAGVGLLIENNTERRRIQEETFIKCKEIVTLNLRNDLFLVIDAKDGHEGIAGIVAGKIKDEFGKPTIIVTNTSGEGYLKGTGRSIDGINLFDILQRYKELFIKFGGHAGACGFLMKADMLEELRSCLNKEVEKIYQDNPNLFHHSLPIDVTIFDHELDMDLVVGLEKLGPFGCQNEKPLFLMKAITPTDVLYMGHSKQHAKFIGTGDRSKGFSCVLFNKAQNYMDILQEGKKMDIMGYPDINIWNGNSKIQFVLKDIK